MTGAVGLVVLYGLTKNWITNNIIGLAFSIQAIALLSLGSFKVGAILLIGLFFYDIFWVFGTEVMVTVAKSFDAPIKLLFPKDILDPNSPFSMLGLGDIVIPGIFISLLLKFDSFRAIGADKNKKKKNKRTQELLESGNFSKPYFYTNFISYILGLVITICVMHFFQAAQPALLYLVPACLGSAILTALVRGELSQLFSYAEQPHPSSTPNSESGNKKGTKEEATPTAPSPKTEKQPQQQKKTNKHTKTNQPNEQHLENTASHHKSRGSNRKTKDFL